jgi:dolichol-phosphate mannosyltransferase
MPTSTAPESSPQASPARPALTLSVIIPAHNEAGLIRATVQGMHATLDGAGIPHELIVVDDASADGTGELLDALAERLPVLHVVHRRPPPGVGRAVRSGLEAMQGDAAVIVMADGSDRPEDVCTYYRTLLEGYDAVFGSRFVAGGEVEGYPPVKLLINRLGNQVMRLLFGRSENDLSNALKAYRADVLRAIGPLESDHFEIFVELPLKTLATGARVATVPVAWYGRRAGASKLKLAKQLPRYARVILRLWLARGDFAGRMAAARAARAARARPGGAAGRMLSL